MTRRWISPRTPRRLGRVAYVHFRAMSCRCERRIASGVTAVDGQPAAFGIGEANLTAHARTEHTILFDQIREGLLPRVSPPAGHGHHGFD
jgi:hypothetical protein